MLMGEALMASHWVLCAGPLVIKAIGERNVHCAHLAARLPDESSRDALIFSFLATLTPLQKPTCPQLISMTHNGQTSVRAAAVPQENMLKTLQWDQAILGLFCQLQNFRFITAAVQASM